MSARKKRLLLQQGGGAAPPPVFDPATLGLSGWWRANGVEYDGVPWIPSASAGTSGANGNLIALSAAPVVGAAQNGHPAASFDGVNQAFKTGTATAADLVTKPTLTAIVLFNAAAAVAITANFYGDPALATDTFGDWGLVFTSSGVRAGVYDGATHQTLSIATATGAYHMAVMRLGGGFVDCRVDQTDALPVATGDIPLLGTTARFGADWVDLDHYQGLMLEIMTSQTRLTNADLDNVRSYFNATYGLSL